METWPTRYEFWLVVLGLGFVVLERFFPWRPGQRWPRPELLQDLFWLLFNGVVFAALFGGFFAAFEGLLSQVLTLLCRCVPEEARLVGHLPLALQVAAVLVTSDFCEWCIHNSLHRVGPLWRIHRVHHSIRTMDWIGNWRFSWFETIVYRTLKYLPILLLGARWEALLITAGIATAIGNLNHANLDVSWGPLRYLLNSPRMHVWHHDPERPGPGVNFAVVFSLWDWVFKTAYMPADRRQPSRFGYRGMERVPDSLRARFCFPFLDRPKETEAPP